MRQELIDMARTYPGLNIRFPLDKSLMIKMLPMRHLFLIKFKYECILFATRYDEHNLGEISDLRNGDFKIIYHNYSINSDRRLFDILNEECPEYHYQIKISNDLCISEDEIDLYHKENFGKDFWAFANRAACNYVGHHFFKNSFEILDDDDLPNFGSDMLAMFSGIAFLSASSIEQDLNPMLAEYKENFGSDLVDVALNQCRAAYSKMYERFQESKFIFHLFDDSFKFLSSY
jgi:hypothetical protein